MFDPVTYLWIIPVKSGQNPICRFRGEVIWMKTVHALTHTHTHDGQHGVTKAQIVTSWQVSLNGRMFDYFTVTICSILSADCLKKNTAPNNNYSDANGISSSRQMFWNIIHIYRHNTQFCQKRRDFVKTYFF